MCNNFTSTRGRHLTQLGTRTARDDDGGGSGSTLLCCVVVMPPRKSFANSAICYCYYSGSALFINDMENRSVERGNQVKERNKACRIIHTVPRASAHLIFNRIGPHLSTRVS